ncbi:MAG: hypothetical protein LBJ78_03635 [Puniceicoccales bacterium]|jgi:hypothetical protein|nr:hypothetical protein [Puniceicoccales bacterium]
MSFSSSDVSGTNARRSVDSPDSIPTGNQGVEKNKESKTGVKGKLQDAKFQKIIDLTNFVESSGKLQNTRNKLAGKSGIFKAIFKCKEKQEAKALLTTILYQVKHFKLAHDQSDVTAMKAWLACAREASPKDRDAIYSAIDSKLSAPGHRINPDILKLLHESTDSRAKSMGDTYLQRSFQAPPSNRVNTKEWNTICSKSAQRAQGEAMEKMQDKARSRLQTEKTNWCVETITVWLEIAKENPKYYPKIQAALESMDYMPEVLILLNQRIKEVDGEEDHAKAENKAACRATKNAYIDIRDGYSKANSSQRFDDFKSRLTGQLKQATSSEVINFFTSTNSLDTKTDTQIQAERQDLANLLEDPSYAQHKTTLQFMSRIYDAYSNADDPHKLTQCIEASFKDALQPAMDQVRKFSSLPEDAVRQQTETIKDQFQTYNRMFDQCLGGKINSMQKQGIPGSLSAKMYSWLAMNAGQVFSQLLPTLDDLAKHGSPNEQAEFLEKAQNRLDKFAIHAARLGHIASSKSDADQRSQIISLTARFPDANFPYELAQHLQKSVEDGSIKNPNVRSDMFPVFTRGDDTTTKANAYLEAAQEQLKNDQLSPEIRSSLEQITFLNGLYLKSGDHNAIHTLGNELKQKPFDIEIVNMLGRACNSQAGSTPVNFANIFSLGNQYIQDHREAFSDHFRNQLNQLIGNETAQGKFIDACRSTQMERPGLRLTNQPIAQLEASQEVIQAMLNSDESKDNAFLKELAAEYQKVIDNKHAKPDFI